MGTLGADSLHCELLLFSAACCAKLDQTLIDLVGEMLWVVKCVFTTVCASGVAFPTFDGYFNSSFLD